MLLLRWTAIFATPAVSFGMLSLLYIELPVAEMIVVFWRTAARIFGMEETSLMKGFDA